MSVVALMGGWRNPVTINRRIFRAAATVGAFSVGVKLIAMFKELAVASYFGRSDAVDVFLAAYLIPGFVVALVAGSLNAAFIPTFIQVREQDGQDAAQRLFSSCMVWSHGLLLGLSVLLAGIAPYLLRALAPGFSAVKLQLCTDLFYAMLPLILLSGVAANFAAIFYARKCFWLPAISPLLTPLLTLVLLLTRARAWGAWSLAEGAVLGGFCECVLLGVALRCTGIRIWPRWHGLTPDVRRVGSQYAPLLLAGVLTSGVTVVDQSMATWLQPGSVAALAYGNRIVGVVVGLTATSLSAAVIPYFSEMVAAREWEACQNTLRTYTRMLLLVMTATCVLLIAFSPALVRLLFQRGAFTVQDTIVVSRVQAMYALQIPFYAAGLLYVRLLTAMKRNDLVMISAGINLGLDVVLNLICMKWLGVAGIALSTSLFYLGSLAFAAVMGRRLLREAGSCRFGVRNGGQFVAG
jgi:putative peptidoglycan lipid II flippase